MDREKLDIFRGLWKGEKSPMYRELERQAEIMAGEAELMKDLREHKGWKLFDEFFTTKQKFINHELKTCSEKDLARHQERAKIIDELYAFMNSKIIRDRDL